MDEQLLWFRYEKCKKHFTWILLLRSEGRKLQKLILPNGGLFHGDFLSHKIQIRQTFHRLIQQIQGFFPTEIQPICYMYGIFTYI